MNSLNNYNEEIKQIIICYLTKTINEADGLRLKHWIETDKLHKDYFDKLKGCWILAGKESGAKKFDSEVQWNNLKKNMELESKKKHIKFKTKVLALVGIAASWVFFFVFGSFSHSNYGKSLELTPKTTEITAPLGSKSIVKLPDGTIVWLNAGSKITYNQDFDKKDRNIQLVGEAYFSVAINKAKPFTVKTSGIMIKALGTRFNVKSYPEEKTITATLEEGKIDVEVLKKSFKGKKQIILTPNQKIVYYKKSNDFEEQDMVNKSLMTRTRPTAVSSEDKDMEVALNVNTELYTSWKDGRWIIESMPLITLAPMLERRFNMTIKFNKEDLKNYNFSGTIEKETIEQILAAMQLTAPIDYDIQKDTIILTSNKRLKTQYSRLVKFKTS